MMSAGFAISWDGSAGLTSAGAATAGFGSAGLSKSFWSGPSGQAPVLPPWCRCRRCCPGPPASPPARRWLRWLSSRRPCPRSRVAFVSPGTSAGAAGGIDADCRLRSRVSGLGFECADGVASDSVPFMPSIVSRASAVRCCAMACDRIATARSLRRLTPARARRRRSAAAPSLRPASRARSPSATLRRAPRSRACPSSSRSTAVRRIRSAGGCSRAMRRSRADGPVCIATPDQVMRCM